MDTLLRMGVCKVLIAHNATRKTVAKQKCLAFHKWHGYISDMLTNSVTYTST